MSLNWACGKTRSFTFKAELVGSGTEGRPAGFYLEFLQLLEGFVAAFVGGVDVHFELSQVQLQLLLGRDGLRSLPAFIFQLRLKLMDLRSEGV